MVEACELSPKELTAGKETEGQRQLLMFGSRHRRAKSRKLRTPYLKFLATPLICIIKTGRTVKSKLNTSNKD